MSRCWAEPISTERRSGVEVDRCVRSRSNRDDRGVGDDGLVGAAVEGVLRELERVIERLGNCVVPSSPIRLPIDRDRDRVTDRDVFGVDGVLDREMFGERVVVRSRIRLPIDCDRDGVSDRDVLGVDGVLDREILGERVVVVSPIRLPILCDCVTDRDVLGADGADGVDDERVIRVDVLLLVRVLLFVFTRVLVFVFVRVDTF